MPTQNTKNSEFITNAIANLATITVTFNPSMEELQTQLSSLPPSSTKILVDNASPLDKYEKITILCSQFQNAHVIRNETNQGLAAAINHGVSQAIKLTPDLKFILLLDQDSEPHPGSIEILLAAFFKLQAMGVRVGCVGPSLVDSKTGLSHGFHKISHGRWTRAYPPTNVTTPVPCDNINGSGTLMPATLFLQLGGLDSALFIDHVDTEWSFRVIAHGYSLWGIPDSVFDHSMGQTSVRFWFFGWRVWPVRSPQRHYYLYRNATILLKRGYIPLVWKFWALVKLFLTSIVMAVTGPNRRKQIINMSRGILAGLNKNAT